MGVLVMQPRAVLASLGLLAVVVCSWPVAGGQEKASKGTKEPGLPKELVPKQFTMQGKDLALAKVLAELAKQTGNQVVDRRTTKEDTKLKLDLKDVPFWQALDAIAKEAD